MRLAGISRAEKAALLLGERDVRIVQGMIRERSQHGEIVLNNVKGLISRVLDQWAAEHGKKLGLIEPGKPEQNAVMQRFNGRIRDECLNSHWFTSLADARQIIEAWRLDYNQVRPQSSLAYRTPTEVFHQFVGSFTTLEAVGVS